LTGPDRQAPPEQSSSTKPLSAANIQTLERIHKSFGYLLADIDKNLWIDRSLSEGLLVVWDSEIQKRERIADTESE